MKRFLSILLLALVLAGLWTGVAAAQGSSPTDDQVNAIAKQLFCPVCENTPLDVCPTQACAQWRALIRQMLSEGYTEAEIKQYFVDNYGARVLAEPPRQGVNWLVYLVPPVLILAGVYILVRQMRAMRATNAAQPPAGPPADEYVARLEEELRKLD